MGVPTAGKCLSYLVIRPGTFYEVKVLIVKII